MFSRQDYEFMSQALRLANNGLYSTDPNPRVGCVMVKDNKLIGEGWHYQTGEAHAEVHAIANANSRQMNACEDATVYVTLEPCSHHGKTPPCVNGLIESGVKRVVIASQDPNPLVAGQGIQALSTAGIKVELGLLEAQSRQLNVGFFSRMEKKRPFVRLKMAMSLDGKTALASGESQWITSATAREDVQKFRARSSAILTGVNTVLLDDPALNVRHLAEFSSDQIRQPLRIILDSHLRTPLTAKILNQPGKVLIVTTASTDEDRKRFELRSNVEVMVSKKTLDGRVDLEQLLSRLAECDVNELHVECGATLAGGLISAGCVDEIIIYMAPLFLGKGARSLIDLPEIQSMSDRMKLKIVDLVRVGDDFRITAKLEKP